MSKTYISKYMSNIAYLQWHDILGNLICMVLFSGIYLPLINEPSIKVHFYFYQNLIFKILKNALQHINVCTIRIVSAAAGGKWLSPVYLRKSSCSTVLYNSITDFFSFMCKLGFLKYVFANNDISWFV